MPETNKGSKTKVKPLNENTLFRKTIRLAAIITESTLSPINNDVDNIVTIIASKNITHENDKLLLTIARAVGIKLNALEFDRKEIMCCVIPIVKFVLEGNCKYIDGSHGIMINKVADKIISIAAMNNRISQTSCGGSMTLGNQDKYAGKRIEEYLRKRYKVKVDTRQKLCASSLIADFVVSHVEVTKETINFFLCKLYNTTTIDRAISRKRYFIEIALCTAVKIMNLGGDRRVIKSIIFSILESIEDDEYTKLKIDARKINLLSESLAKSALKPSALETSFYQKKERVARLISDLFTSTRTKVSEGIVDFLTFELLPDNKGEYLYVRSYVLVALLAGYKVKKFKGSMEMMQNAALAALSQIHLQSTTYISLDEYQIHALAKSIAQSTIDQSVAQITTATSSSTKVSKKALLAKEVEILTSNIVRTVIEENLNDDDDITTSSVDHIIDEYLNYKQKEIIMQSYSSTTLETLPILKAKRIKKIHRTFIELSLRAALVAKNQGGDVSSISAAAASILSCRRFRNYKNLDVSPQMMKRLAVNVASQLLD